MVPIQASQRTPEGEDWQAVSEAASDLVENTTQALQQAAIGG